MRQPFDRIPLVDGTIDLYVHANDGCGREAYAIQRRRNYFTGRTYYTYCPRPLQPVLDRLHPLQYGTIDDGDYLPQLADDDFDREAE
jgi:hypothetical protein